MDEDEDEDDVVLDPECIAPGGKVGVAHNDELAPLSSLAHCVATAGLDDRAANTQQEQIRFKRLLVVVQFARSNSTMLKSFMNMLMIASCAKCNRILCHQLSKVRKTGRKWSGLSAF